jgi:hypothetical protein
VIRIDDK